MDVFFFAKFVPIELGFQKTNSNLSMGDNCFNSNNALLTLLCNPTSLNFLFLQKKNISLGPSLPALGNVNLVDFDLSYSNLESPIPHTFANLTTIFSLNLEQIWLFESLPNFIYQREGLQSLDLFERMFIHLILFYNHKPNSSNFYMIKLDISYNKLNNSIFLFSSNLYKTWLAL